MSRVINVNAFTYLTDETFPPNESGRIIVTQINQRAGVWKIKISADNIVTLDFVSEVFPNDTVRVSKGQSYGGSVLTYSSTIAKGNTVPEYIATATQNKPSFEKTTFDGNGTKFLQFRDEYAPPEINDKYLKFPKIGVFT